MGLFVSGLREGSSTLFKKQSWVVFGYYLDVVRRSIAIRCKGVVSFALRSIDECVHCSFAI